MAAETEQWILQLVDQASGNAAAMAGGFKALDSAQLQAASSALKMQGAQRALAQAENAGSIAGRASAQDAIKRIQLGDAMKAAKAQEATAAKAAAAEIKAAEAAKSDAMTQTASAIQTVQHPIDAATSALSKMGPQGMAAAAALAVLTAAITVTVGTLVAGAAKAIEMTERVRALREGFAGLAGSATGGKAVQDMIGGLNLPFATAQVNTWAASLVGAGVKGKQLENELKAIAGAEALKAAFGGGGGAAAENFFKMMGNGGKEADEMLKKIQQGGRRGAEAIKAMGLNVEDLGGQAAIAKMKANELTAAVTAALAKKGAGPLEAMASSWDVIKMKAAEGFASIFGGLTGAKGPVETFMSAVRSLFSEFNKGGVAINLLKPIVTVVFTKLFTMATWALGAVHKGFLYLAIAGLTAYIALRPLLTWIYEFMTSANMLRGAALVLAVLALPFVLLAAVGLVVVATIGTIIGVVVALAAAFFYVIGAIVGFVASIGSAFADAYSAATGAGGSIIDGLIAGISAGAGAVFAALKGLASSGLKAFKGIFGIASPSKVMLEHGEKNIAGAAATGVDRGADKMDVSMERLGGGGAKGASRGGKDGGGGERHVHFHYAGPEDQADGFFEKAAMWLRELDAEALENAL